MTNCPICYNISTEKVYSNKNIYFAFKDVKFDLTIDICNGCGYVFQSSAYNDFYDEIVLEEYSNYKRDEKYPFPNMKKDNIDTLNMIIENLPEEKYLNILEIGSNRGDLLYMIKEKTPHSNILGIEPTKFENLTVPTINKYFKKDIFSNKFNVIIMQHVFEHIKYPQKIISEIKGILDKNGILYIEVPNLENSLNYGLEDFILEHVSYFTSSTIEFVLDGFDIIKSNATSHIRIIARLTDSKKKPLNDSPFTNEEIKKKFINFHKTKDEITGKILQYSKSNRKIVFYGVSYYFRVLFKELRKYLDTRNCFYFDDNYIEKNEDAFGLPRLQKFDDECVIIICSTVSEVQEAIKNKLSFYKNLTIIRPWLK